MTYHVKNSLGKTVLITTDRGYALERCGKIRGGWIHTVTPPVGVLPNGEDYIRDLGI